MPWVVKLGGDPDLLTRHAGVFDTLANLVLVAVRKRSVDVAVARKEGSLDGLADLVRLGLPCPKTNSWNFGTLGVSVSLLPPSMLMWRSTTYSVEGERLLGPVQVLCHLEVCGGYC